MERAPRGPHGRGAHGARRSCAGCRVRHQQQRTGRRHGGRHPRALRPCRRPRQQRPDLPAASAVGNRRRGGRRRLLRLGRQRHALGHAGRVPAHAAGGLGQDRQRRFGGRNHRHAGLRRLQRVQGGDQGADAHGGAGVGPGRRRRQLHLPGRGVEAGTGGGGARRRRPSRVHARPSHRPPTTRSI